MDGYFAQPLKALGGEPHAFWGSFCPNAASNPDSDNNGGPPGLKAFSTVYAATGLQTVTLPEGCVPVGTATITVSAQAASTSEWFEVCTVGPYDSSTRSFTVFTHRSGTGREVPASTDARVHFTIHFNNSTGA